ncbi:MAG: peptidoglycan-binding protein [Acidobacteria bacterium]|nr:peptidoglycan-binding protein [Acidobacteriota bacterium]
MKQKSYIALLLAAALVGNAFAQSKKPIVPATVTPVKTVKVLTSRLAAAARPLPAKEDAKAKKNGAPANKAAAKPVAVAKLTTTRKTVASEKAIQLTTKAKPATAAKLAAKDVNTKAQQLNANDGLRKGKFGKDTRPVLTKPVEESARTINAKAETKRTLKPLEPKRPAELIVAQREDKREEEPAPRRLRPRVADYDDEPKADKKEEKKEEAEERIADAPKLPLAKPDRIEVIEPDSPQIVQLQALPNLRPLPSYGAIVTRTGTPPTARKDISIPQQRVFEIQYELAKRGFYTAEPNGLYDDVMVAAMWEFQKNYGLPATGYPTAHALKRLGLTSW